MDSSPFRVDGKVVLVTGGAGHLGTAMCGLLAQLGATVVVADIDGHGAAECASALVDKGLEALGLQMDVVSEESVAATFATVQQRFGGLDVLVNNAAPSSDIRQDGPLGDITLETWDAVVDGILRAAVLCTRQAIPRFIERGGGSIVNVASSHGHTGDPDLSAYPVAKAGLLGLTRTIATQYGRHGIRCNSVSPGPIPHPGASPEWLERKLKHQLLPEQGRPADAAGVVAFLASPASAFVTGTDVLADGGLLAHVPSYADPGARLTQARAEGRVDRPGSEPR